MDVAIMSWFGPDSNSDRARIHQMLDETLKRQTSMKWAIYYEDEWKHDASVSLLQEDLAYLKKWFVWHPTFAFVNGKPLIYIWNESDCEVISRWMEAASGEWHVIPKLFEGYQDCTVQPDNWHQYGPAKEIDEFEGHSVSISPGFWHAGDALSRLPRLTERQWCDNIQYMVDTREPWQLVTTFNEAGEGTGIESSSKHWPSESGYGYYLDCLHAIV